MRRTLLAASLPALVVAFSWVRLDEGGAPVYAAVAFALAPALLPRLGLRLAALAPALVGALWIAFGISPLEARPRDETHEFFGPLWSRFTDGLSGFYDVRVPFDGAEQPNMQGILLIAAFGFCVVLSLAVASRKPILALLALLAGAGWPLTLLPSGGVVYGAILLVAALWLLAGLRVERPTPALAAGALVVLAATGISTSPAIAKDAVLDWQRWEPYGSSDKPVNVDFVWDANYGGIDFPRKETVVLRIRGPERSLYWRATTLDRFADDRWIDDLNVVATEVAGGRLLADPLLPAAAASRTNWTTQEVEVVGLSDEHLVGATTPVAVQAKELGRVDQLAGSVLRGQSPLRRGQRYTVDSYAPRPEPVELATLAAEYPVELLRFLELGRTSVSPFGTPGRATAVRSLFRDERYFPLWPYRGMYREAERLATGARGPYGAVVAIETWLRTTGGFTYDERPPTPPVGAPPLADFVDSGRRGYCQQFAGAMTLMLRFLGIPARVAAGFTSGSYANGVWTVTDRNAHTWVEVWFPGYGWLSFDPTPGRGELGANYSASSNGFNPGDAAFGGFRSGIGGFDQGGGAGELGRLTELKERRAANRGITVRDEGISTLWILLGLVAVTGAAIGLAKLVWRRSRYLTDDPRRLAGAARRELAGFLLDQGVEVAPSATPEELQALVRAHLGIDAGPFARAVAQARYGPPAGSGAAASLARRELRSLLRAIRRSIGRFQRLRGYVALRSLRT